MTGRDGRPSNDAAFLKWRFWHELAHAWYAGSTQHNCGVCMGHCTLDPLGSPRCDTLDWEVSSHQQRKSLCLCTDISLPLYQRDPQIKVAFRSFLHTTQSEVSRFLATSTSQKMSHRSFYKPNFQGVLLTADSEFYHSMVTLAQALQQNPASGHSFASQYCTEDSRRS